MYTERTSWVDVARTYVPYTPPTAVLPPPPHLLAVSRGVGEVACQFLVHCLIYQSKCNIRNEEEATQEEEAGYSENTRKTQMYNMKIIRVQVK